MRNLHRKLRRLASGAAMTIAVGIGAAGCSEPPAPAEVVRPVLTREVAPPSDIAAVAAFAGEVRARHESDLAFRIPGKVIARHVETGSVVKRGQLLARLDPQDVQLQAESARAQVASAEAEQTWAKAEFDRYQALHEKQFVSSTVLDQKRNALASAEARLRQMRAQQSVSANQSAYASLVAETDGVVTTVNLEPGQVVAAGQPVLRIARPEDKEVAISVPEGRIEELRRSPGLFVTLWTDPGRRLQARVREIAPHADPVTRTFAVRVTVVAPGEAVRLGMSANVIVPGARAVTGVIVPLTAVGDVAGKPTVWVVDTQASTVRPVPAEVHAWLEHGAVITSGLQGGERIVVVGVQKLRAGQKIRQASADEERTFAGAPPTGRPGATMPMGADGPRPR